MKKVTTIALVGTFIFSLVLPISGIAGEEIQLAAAIGSNKASAANGSGAAGSAGTGTAATTTGATVAAGAGMSTATMVTLGVITAGVVVAAGKTESTSNH